jgi:hypothetical protein
MCQLQTLESSHQIWGLVVCEGSFILGCVRQGWEVEV